MPSSWLLIRWGTNARSFDGNGQFIELDPFRQRNGHAGRDGVVIRPEPAKGVHVAKADIQIHGETFFDACLGTHPARRVKILQFAARDEQALDLLPKCSLLCPAPAAIRLASKRDQA